MPIVEVNGQEIEFPDSMNQEAIKAVLRKKFPPSVSTTPQANQIRDGLGITDIPRNQAEQEALRNADKSVLARTGRAGLSIITAPSDLIYAAGAVPYNAVRSIQQATGAKVAPPITIPSPNEYVKSIYDKYTGNAGQSEGAAKIADTAAEYIASGGGLGKSIPSMGMKTGGDVVANAAAGGASEYTKQEVSDNPIAQMLASIAAAIGTQGATGGVKNAVAKTAPEIKATDKVLQRLEQGGISPASIKPGLPLIDLGGKNVERLGEAVANIPGKGADIAEKFVAGRAASAGKRIKQNIADYISAGGDANETADAIMKAGRERAAPKYKAAYNIDIIPDKVLKEIMQRPSMVQAAKNAERIAADEGKDLSTLGTKTEFYDYVKRGLDDVLEGYRDKTTGKMVLDTQGRAIDNLRKDYIKILDDRNPALKEARAESATYFESRNALQDGQDFLDKTPIQLRKTMKGLSSTDRQLFKLGIANKLKDMVNSANIGSDIGRRIFNKEDYQDNLRAVLEPKEYGQLKRSLNREMEMHKLNQKLLGNSRTMLRKEEIDDLMQDPSDLITMATNPGKFGLGKITQFMTNKYQGLNKEVAGEVAKMLFETNPAKQKDIIFRLQKRAITGYKPAIRGFVLLNKISDTTKRTALLNIINQGE